MSTRTNILTMEYEGDVSSSSSTTSTSTTHARAREVIDYAAGMGLKPTQMMESAIETYIRLRGFETEVLKAVIDETMFAPQPSWRYFSAILRRLMMEGCVTYDQWVDRQDRWANGKQGIY